MDEDDTKNDLKRVGLFSDLGYIATKEKFRPAAGMLCFVVHQDAVCTLRSSRRDSYILGPSKSLSKVMVFVQK